MPSVAEILSRATKDLLVPMSEDHRELREEVEDRVNSLRRDPKRRDIIFADSNRLGPTLQGLIQVMRGESKPDPTEQLIRQFLSKGTADFAPPSIPVIFCFSLGRDPDAYQGSVIGYLDAGIAIDTTESPAAIQRFSIVTETPIVKPTQEINLRTEVIPAEHYHPSKQRDIGIRKEALSSLPVNNNLLALQLLNELARAHAGILEPLPPKIITDPWSSHNDPSIWGAPTPLVPGRIHGHGAYRPPRYP